MSMFSELTAPCEVILRSPQSILELELGKAIFQALGCCKLCERVELSYSVSDTFLKLYGTRGSECESRPVLSISWPRWTTLQTLSSTDAIPSVTCPAENGNS